MTDPTDSRESDIRETVQAPLRRRGNQLVGARLRPSPGR